MVSNRDKSFQRGITYIYIRPAEPAKGVRRRFKKCEGMEKDSGHFWTFCFGGGLKREILHVTIFLSFFEEGRLYKTAR